MGVGPPHETVPGACDLVMVDPGADNTSMSAMMSADTPRQTAESADAPWQTVGSADAPWQTVGSADTPRQTMESADTSQTAESADTPWQTEESADTPWQTMESADTSQTAESADAPWQTVGSADTPWQTAESADTPRQTMGSADSDARRLTVESADAPWQTVGPADAPRQTMGSADSDARRLTVESADAPWQTVGPADAPRSAGLSIPSELAADFAAALAGSRQQMPAAPAPPLSGGSDTPPLLLALAAGWRVAGDQAASRALRLASPDSARQSLQDWVDPSTCVLLEREDGSSSDQRPGLTLTVAAGHPVAIAEIALLSEFGRCELYGDHGEYLATEDAELDETVDDTEVLSLRHRCRPPVTQLTLQCVSAAGRRQLWLYGLEVVLQPAAVRPSQSVFSMPAVLARLEAQAAPLPEGAETLRAALASAGGRGEPPTMAALAAAFAGGRRPTAETSTGRAQKLECEAGRQGATVPAGIEAAVGHCVARMEEKLWQRISPRLEDIERKQDVILERLDKLSLRRTDTHEK